MLDMGRESFYEEDVNIMWNRMASAIRNVAKDTLGVTSSKIHD